LTAVLFEIKLKKIRKEYSISSRSKIPLSKTKRSQEHHGFAFKYRAGFLSNTVLQEAEQK
jgi:hypothetical protein